MTMTSRPAGRSCSVFGTCAFPNCDCPPATPEPDTPETDAFSNPSTEGDEDSYVTIENYNALLECAARVERRLAQSQERYASALEDNLRKSKMYNEAQARIAALEKALKEFVRIDEEEGGLYAQATATSDLVLAIDAAKDALKDRA